MREIIEHLAAQTSEDIHDRIHEEIMEQGVGVRHDLPVEEWPTWMTERLARKKPSKRMPDYIDVTQSSSSGDLRWQTHSPTKSRQWSHQSESSALGQIPSMT